MTTLVFVENVLGSGLAVKLTEDFGDYSVSRELKPGDNTRLVVSPFKSLTVEEVPCSAFQETNPANQAQADAAFPAPRTLERRHG